MNEFAIYQPIFKLEKSLKRLYFRGCVTHFHSLNFNCLTQLVQLRIELDIHSYGSEEEVIELNLPNLKVLEIGEIGEYYSDLSELHLNTPKLERLKCHKIESIHLVHPSTIHHLELVCYSETAHLFENVQYLKVNWQHIRHRNILSIFPKLRTLVCTAFDDESEVDLDDENEEDFDASIHALHHLVVSKKPEQKVYFLSVELNAENIDKGKTESLHYYYALMTHRK